MTPRAKQWWLIGATAWLAFGVAPSFVLWLAPTDIELIALSIAGGLGVFAAILISPRPRRWAWGAPTLIWCFGWFWWFEFVMGAASFIVEQLIDADAIVGSTGFLANLGHEISVALILSCLITTALVTLLTRSWRIGMLTLIPGVVFALSWMCGVDVWWDDALWHPIVIGALILWAVRKRVRPFPVHACQSCGYDMRGLDSDVVCPECGGASLRRTARIPSRG